MDIVKRRECGTSGLELPVIGVGVWCFGGGDYWGRQNQSDADAIVARAIELGCNYFDTAEMYNDGASEESFGRALKGRREKAIIGTKVSPANTQPATLRAHCEASLRRLATDYIDLYMIHWPLYPQSIAKPADDAKALTLLPSTGDALAELAKLRDEGKIRHVGVSNFGAEQLADVLDTGIQIAANQLIYSLLTRAIEFEVADFCRDRGVGIIAYMPLMQGLLAGKFRSIDDLPPQRARTRHFANDRGGRHGEAGAEGETFAALDAIREIAAAEGTSMVAVALAWCAANPAITCVLAGARNLDQLETNASAAAEALQPQTIEQLNAATEAVKTRLGPRCDYWESAAMTRTW